MLLLRPEAFARYGGIVRVESVVLGDFEVSVPLLNGVDHMGLLRRGTRARSRNAAMRLDLLSSAWRGSRDELRASRVAKSRASLDTSDSPTPPQPHTRVHEIGARSSSSRRDGTAARVVLWPYPPPLRRSLDVAGVLDRPTVRHRSDLSEQRAVTH